MAGTGVSEGDAGVLWAEDLECGNASWCWCPSGSSQASSIRIEKTANRVDPLL